MHGERPPLPLSATEGAAARSGFDRVAERYDADLADNRVLVHMRARSLAHLRGAFPRGSTLLEIGSGTGAEASVLARGHGCRIALVDPSRALLAKAVAKLSAQREEALLGAHALPAGALDALVEAYGVGFFDGAYSSLGPLNCEPSLGPAARSLALLVRSGGAVVLSLLNRWYPAEVAWFLARGRVREATRRWRGPVFASTYGGGPKDVLTHYYSLREISLAFAPSFTVEHVEALPLVVPPPYLDFLLGKLPGWALSGEGLGLLGAVERWAAPKSFLRALGDHVLVRLRRRRH